MMILVGIVTRVNILSSLPCIHDTLHSMVCNMPAGIGDLEWREATNKAGGVSNPNRLWPVAVSGFDELLQRKNAQVSVSWSQAMSDVWLPCIMSVCPFIHPSWHRC